MAKQKIRFGVGGPEIPRSAIWSMLWRDQDVYVVSVEAGGIAKFSFHLKIGELSWGYTRNYFEPNKQFLWPRESRDFERWKRPPEYARGLTLPLRIYVANEALSIDTELPTKKLIRWVQPQPGKAVGFMFILAAADLPENPYASRPDLELLARATLSARDESMLLYAHQIDAATITTIANGAVIEMARRDPGLRLPQRHRVYTETSASDASTGSRNFLETPTYVLPFVPSAG